MTRTDISNWIVTKPPTGIHSRIPQVTTNEALTTQVFPDLHHFTGFSGEMFFGTACGADPCMVAGHDKPCL